MPEFVRAYVYTPEEADIVRRNVGTKIVIEDEEHILVNIVPAQGVFRVTARKLLEAEKGGGTT